MQATDVAPAEALRQPARKGKMDAALQLWIDVSHDAFRKPVDDILLAACGRIDAWAVLESALIPTCTIHHAMVRGPRAGRNLCLSDRA